MIELIPKITAEQLAQMGVVAAPDRLTGNPKDNKLIFDRLIREVVAVAVNTAIDVLNEMIPAENERAAAEAAREEAESNRESAEADRRATFGSVLEQAEGYSMSAEESAMRARNYSVLASGARNGAEIAQQKAEMATTRKPFPNPETGTWWIWDGASSTYIDSGESYDGNMLYVTFEVDEWGILYARIPDGYHGPTFAINDVGELEVFYD